MAVGDRIYIADKETLDNVKSTVNTVKTTVDSVVTKSDDIKSTVDGIKTDTTAIRSGMTSNTNSILSAINSNAPSKDYFTVADISTNKLKYGSAISRTAGNTVLHTVSGSGVLYGLIYKCSYYATTVTGTDTLYLSLDDATVYASSYQHSASEYYGILTPAMLMNGIGSGSNVYVPGAQSVNLGTRPIATNPVAAGNSIVYFPKPVRFERSLTITGSLSSVSNLVENGTVYYMYKLD